MSHSDLLKYVVTSSAGSAVHRCDDLNAARTKAMELARQGFVVGVYALEAMCSPGEPVWEDTTEPPNLKPSLREGFARLANQVQRYPDENVDDDPTYRRPPVGDYEDPPTSIPGLHLACTVHPESTAVYQLEDMHTGRVKRRMCPRCREEAPMPLPAGSVLRAIQRG